MDHESLSEKPFLLTVLPEDGSERVKSSLHGADEATATVENAVFLPVFPAVQTEGEHGKTTSQKTGRIQVVSLENPAFQTARSQSIRGLKGQTAA